MIAKIISEFDIPVTVNEGNETKDEIINGPGCSKLFTYKDRLRFTANFEYSRLKEISADLDEVQDPILIKVKQEQSEERENFEVDRDLTIKRNHISSLDYYLSGMKGKFFLLIVYTSDSLLICFDKNKQDIGRDLYNELLEWWLDD